jgi:hypothetical protein
LKKILHKKRTGGVAQGIGLEFKSQYQKKKKKKEWYSSPALAQISNPTS